MPTLRFDTDEGRAVAAAMRQAAEMMQAEVNRAGSSVEGLVPADWAAPAADQFAGLSRDWQQTMTQTLERLTDLTRRLEAEIVQWEEAAARFGEGGGAIPAPTTYAGQINGIGTIEGWSSEDLPGVTERNEIPWWQRRLEDWFGQALDNLLPPDIANADEFIGIKGELEGVVPLAELGLPFSGYVNMENGFTITRSEDGAYHIIFDMADSGGADYSQSGGWDAQIGLLGTTQVELAFDPQNPGDLSKMAMFMTAMGAAGIMSLPGGTGMIDQFTGQLSTMVLKDNLISSSERVGVEVDADIKAAGIGVEGTKTIGIETRRDSLNDTSWEKVISYQIEGDVETDFLPAGIGVNGEISAELTFNAVVDAQTGQQSAEVILEYKSAPGAGFSLEDIAGLFPGATVDLGVEEGMVGSLQITCTLDSPVESVIHSVQNGNLNTILENSAIEITGTSGISTTIEGELKGALSGQSIGIGGNIEITQGAIYHENITTNGK